MPERLQNKIRIMRVPKKELLKIIAFFEESMNQTTAIFIVKTRSRSPEENEEPQLMA